MSVPIAATIDEAADKRWHEWQLRNEDDRRVGVRRARVVFTLLFIALGVWFGLQLVS